MTYYPETFTETFNRADSTDLGLDWEYKTGATRFQIVSNRLTLTDDASASVYFYKPHTGLDAYATLDVASNAIALAGATWTVGIVLRASTDTSLYYLLRYLGTFNQPANPNNYWSISYTGSINLVTFAEVRTAPFTIVASIRGNTIAVGDTTGPKVAYTANGVLPFTNLGLRMGVSIGATGTGLQADNFTTRALDIAPVAGAVSFPSTFSMPVSPSPYHRYKTVRAAAQTYSNLSLAP